jgi:[ribosomal protein S5]-alanine N-acetyltransferase
LQHQGTKTIETERLILRRLTPGDAEAGFKNWASDPEVTKYITWPPYEELSVWQKYISELSPRYTEDDFYFWCIVPKESGGPIGTISVVKIDERTDMLEIGYVIGKSWWHSGITSEALAALIKFFFQEVKANRIQAKHDPNNPNSGKVMLKCGMKFEGIMRKASRSNQGIIDSAMYAILAEDYIK